MQSTDKTVCFICGQEASFKTVYTGLKAEARDFSIQVCKSCGLGRTEPFLAEAELSALYSGVEYRGDDAKRFPAVIEKAVAFLRAGRRKAVERLCSLPAGDARSILDVGCGRGDFLLLMREGGWNCTGLELDSRAESRGKALGFEIKNRSLEDAKFKGSSFNAVTFWHVFEHVRRPVEALSECERILKPGGLLVVAVPNLKSLQARVSGKRWFHLDPPYHLYHYSPANLSVLVEKAGFEVKAVKHFSLEYNPYGWLQSMYNLLGFKTNLLYDFLRGRAEKSLNLYLNILLMTLLLPLLGPLSILLSVMEAMAGMGGTIELYAVKR